MLRCGMFQRPFPCRKVVIRRSLVRPNSFVGQELSPEMYQCARWRDSCSIHEFMRKIAPKYKDFVGEWQRLNQGNT